MLPLKSKFARIKESPKIQQKPPKCFFCSSIDRVPTFKSNIRVLLLFKAQYPLFILLRSASSYQRITSFHKSLSLFELFSIFRSFVCILTMFWSFCSPELSNMPICGSHAFQKLTDRVYSAKPKKYSLAS